MQSSQSNSEHGLLLTCLSVRRNVVPSVLTRCEFWFFLVFHTIVTVCYKRGLLPGAEDRRSHLGVDADFWDVLVFLAILLTVFMTQALMAKYMRLYTLTRSLFGQIMDIALRLSMTCPQSYTRLSIRYLLGAVMLFFMETHGQLEERHWEEMQANGLLMSDEKTRLEGLGVRSERSLILLHWATDVARQGFRAGKVTNTHVTGAVNKFTQMRQAQQEMVDQVRFTFPKLYVHLAELTLFACLVILGYSMALTMSIWGTVAYFTLLFVFLGLVELGNQLQNPFGDDEIDFPMARWLQDVAEHVATLVECERPSKDSGLDDGPLQHQLKGFPQAFDIDMDMDM
mmetsp:Transcript_20397/g.45727  ORF Transcript_20397/g.45727 Transcript_20397/m.45727 type:complete len:341 (+) Transcript_20397:139-1161(+)